MDWEAIRIGATVTICDCMVARAVLTNMLILAVIVFFAKVPLQTNFFLGRFMLFGCAASIPTS